MSTVHPLRAFREKHSLSQEELAERLGVSRVAVTRWEAGSRKIEQSLISRIAEETGISAAELRPDLAALFEGTA